MYAEGWILVARVAGGRAATLALRVPAGYQISDARSQGDEIRFSLAGRGKIQRLALRLLDDEVLVVVRPGEEPFWCGTCTPRYLRLDGWVRLKIEGLKDRAADWLVDVMAEGR